MLVNTLKGALRSGPAVPIYYWHGSSDPYRVYRNGTWHHW
jgi:hypothetical protein